MFQGKTLFFIGAGASVSYGFPIGSDFVQLICEDINSGGPMTKYLTNEVGYSINELREFEEDFIGARFSTIDEFMHTRPELKKIGKAVVAAKIIEYENPLKIPRLPNDWVSVFLSNIIPSGSEFNDTIYRLQKYQFYSLNYDRTIEHILFQLLLRRLPKADRTEQSLKNLLKFANRVQHPHGSLGPLGLNSNAISSRAYVTDYPHPNVFKKIRNNIRFVDELTNEPQAFSEFNAVIEGVDNIVFLGFKYHDKILNRIKRDHLLKKRIYGTTFLENEDSIKDLKSALECPRPHNMTPQQLNDFLNFHNGRIKFAKPDINCDDYFRLAYNGGRIPCI